MVKADDVLLAIDDQQYRHEEALAAAKLRLAEAEFDRIVNGARSQQRTEAAALLRAKQAELERAELAWKRIDGLREAKAVSQQEADNQRTLVSSLAAEVEAALARRDLAEAPARDDEMAMARARIEAAKAQWELAKVQLDRTRLRAPIAGQILAVDTRVGELAGPDSPKPVVTMADTTTLRVRAFVEELDAPPRHRGHDGADRRRRLARSGIPRPRYAAQPPDEPQGTLERPPRRTFRHQDPPKSGSIWTKAKGWSSGCASMR